MSKEVQIGRHWGDEPHMHAPAQFGWRGHSTVQSSSQQGALGEGEPGPP